MRKTAFCLIVLALSLATPAEAGMRNFFLPEIAGARVDACLDGGSCGKPAADAFCKLQGYDKATIFQREPAAMSRRIDSGKTCSSTSCTAFRQVKCFTTKTDQAALSS